MGPGFLILVFYNIGFSKAMHYFPIAGLLYCGTELQGDLTLQCPHTQVLVAKSHGRRRLSEDAQSNKQPPVMMLGVAVSLS
jgi:hypothetical protein